VGGGGGIDHHLIASGLAREAGDLQPRHQLVGPRQSKAEKAVDVLGIQVGAAGGDLAQGLAVLLRPAATGRVGCEQGAAAGVTVGGDNEAGLGREAGPQGIAEGGGGIRGNGENALTGFSGGESGGGGAGRLADAPLAAEEAEGGKRRP
jgi:hypothetical protein